MPNQKPIVGAALLCEKILREAEGTLSAIRIVDTYTMSVQELKVNSVIKGDQPDRVLDVGPGALLDMSALVLLRAGDDVRGEHAVTLRVRNPEGKETEFPGSYPVRFNKNDPAESTQFNIRFMMNANSQPGQYWLEVLWDGEPLTRIPLRLVKEPESPASAQG